MSYRNNFYVLSMFLIAGCSIQPAQQEATAIRTADIVEHIRCEAKAAIQQETQTLLRRQVNSQFEIDERAVELAEYLKANPDEYVMWPAHFPSEQRFIDFNLKYINTGIALEFTFDIKEDNALGGSIDPAGLISHGIVKVPLSASGDFNRENIRKFIVSDTFRGLFLRKCDPQYLDANFAYPISGSIGIYSIIDDFISLNEKEILSNLTDDPVNKVIPVFTDNMTFQTTIMGGASPTITLSPSGHGVRLNDASAMASASRVDKHMLVIGLSLAPIDPKKVAKVTAVPLGGVSSLQTVYARTNVKSGAEQRAIQAITQQRIDNFLDKAVVAIP